MRGFKQGYDNRSGVPYLNGIAEQQLLLEDMADLAHVALVCGRLPVQPFDDLVELVAIVKAVSLLLHRIIRVEA